MGRIDSYRTQLAAKLQESGMPEDLKNSILADYDKLRTDANQANGKIQSANGDLQKLSSGARQVSDGAHQLA